MFLKNIRPGRFGPAIVQYNVSMVRKARWGEGGPDRSNKPGDQWGLLLQEEGANPGTETSEGGKKKRKYQNVGH